VLKILKCEVVLFLERSILFFVVNIPPEEPQAEPEDMVINQKVLKQKIHIVVWKILRASWFFQYEDESKGNQSN
jgi:hypothetical protein